MREIVVVASGLINGANSTTKKLLIVSDAWGRVSSRISATDDHYIQGVELARGVVGMAGTLLNC